MNKTFSIVINAVTSGFDKAKTVITGAIGGGSKEAQASVAALQAELKALDREAATLERQLSQVQGFARLKAEAAALEKEWIDTAAKAAALAEAVRRGEGDTKKLADAFRVTQAEAKHLETQFTRKTVALQKLGGQLDKAGVDTKNLAATETQLTRKLTENAVAIQKTQAAFKSAQAPAVGFFQRTAAASQAFRDRMNESRTATDGLAGKIKTLIATYAGFLSVRSVVDIVRASDAAVFSMSQSVEAANREFDHVGSVAEWRDTVKTLSAELKVYSETALNNAISRTVDMTKRLGLEKEQMEEVIRRSADLSAGKTTLEGGIERVTAALRGEAEASEYLGLTLNENYVKAWHEAHNAHDRAWKDLSDLEKAQVRYNVFLEQTEELQGRAAKSITTIGGAWQFLSGKINDAISGNKKLSDTMVRVGEAITKNAGKIGDFISLLISATATVAGFVVEWGAWIAGFAAAAVAVSAVKSVTLSVMALSAAIKVLTATNISSFFASIASSADKAAVAIVAFGAKVRVVLAAVAAFLGPIGSSIAAFFAGWQVGSWLNSLTIVQKSTQLFFAGIELGATKATIAYLKLKKAWADFKGDTAQSEVLARAIANGEAQLDVVNRTIDGIRDMGKASKQSGKDMADAYDKTTPKIKEIPPILAKMRHEQEATTEEIKEFEKAAKQAYQKAGDEAKAYGEKIKSLNQDIADRQISLEDKIRELRRANMTDEQAAADLKLQAVQKQQAAEAALQKFRETGDQRQAELAREFAGAAENLWSSYAGTSKSATEEAITGLRNVNKILDEADKIEINTFTKLKQDAEDVMREIQSWVDTFNQNAELKVPITLGNLDFVQDKIKDLTKDETKTIYIKTVEKKATGGPVGMAGSGLASGPSHASGGILAEFEGGEYILPKASTRKIAAEHGWGALERLRQGNLPRFDLGGLVSRTLAAVPPAAGAASDPGPVAELGRTELVLDGRAYPVTGRVDVITELQAALKRKQRLRPNK